MNYKAVINSDLEIKTTIILDILEMYSYKIQSYGSGVEKYTQYMNRVIQNTLYDYKSNGFYTGLASEDGMIGNPNDKGGPCYDHVYSRKLSSQLIMDKHLENPLGMDKLMEMLVLLNSSILISPEENRILSSVVEKNNFSIQDLRQMKHYGKADIELLFNPKRPGVLEGQLITKYMKELIVEPKTSPFQKFV